MDIQSVLATMGVGVNSSTSSGSTSSSTSEFNASTSRGAGNNRRSGLFKQRGGESRTARLAENRAETVKRRRSVKEQVILTRRGNLDLSIAYENDENDSTTANVDKSKDVDQGGKMEKLPPLEKKSMRERLQEYKEKARLKKLEEKRKAIPPFRAGVVHHPIAPFKHIPNKIENTGGMKSASSKLSLLSTSMLSSKFGSTMSLNKGPAATTTSTLPARGRTTRQTVTRGAKSTTTAVASNAPRTTRQTAARGAAKTATSSNARGGAISAKSTPAVASKEQVGARTTPATSSVRGKRVTRQSANDAQAVKTPLANLNRSSAKSAEKQEPVESNEVEPVPMNISTSSTESVGDMKSFAPADYKFCFDKELKVSTSPIRAKKSSSDMSDDENSLSKSTDGKQPNDDVFNASPILPVNVKPTASRQSRRSTRASSTLSIVSGSSIDSVEVDMEIQEAVSKNKFAKENEKALLIRSHIKSAIDDVEDEPSMPIRSPINQVKTYITPFKEEVNLSGRARNVRRSLLKPDHTPNSLMPSAEKVPVMRMLAKNPGTPSSKLEIQDNTSGLKRRSSRNRTSTLNASVTDSPQPVAMDEGEMDTTDSNAAANKVESLTSGMEAVQLNSTKKVPLQHLLQKDSPKVSTPTQNGRSSVSTPSQDSGEVFQFKTPTMPVRSVRKAQSAHRLRMLDGSPWINAGRRSAKKKSSLSEEKPRKNDLSALFDDLPLDQGSPIYSFIQKKVKSTDNIAEAMEEIEDMIVKFNRNPAVLEKEFNKIGDDDKRSTGSIAKQDESKSETKDKTGDDTPAAEYVVEKEAKSVDGQEESEHDVPYFRNLLTSETERMTKLCDAWENKIGPTMSDDVQGQVRSVVGQGRLVMAERFKQFSGLVDNCEFGTGEKTTSCMDLQGFWEMIYFQVEDVDKKFEQLSKLEANGWKEPEPVRKVVKKKPVGAAQPGKPGARKPVKAGPSAGLRAMIAAQRMKAKAETTAVPVESNEAVVDVPKVRVTRNSLTPAKKSPPQKMDEDPQRVFDGGFFCIKSPVNSASNSPKSASKLNTRSLNISKSTGADKLRRSVLTESARRVSGLVSPYVSQIARRSLSRDTITPTSRSSLTSPLAVPLPTSPSEGQSETENALKTSTADRTPISKRRRPVPVCEDAEMNDEESEACTPSTKKGRKSARLSVTEENRRRSTRLSVKFTPDSPGLSLEGSGMKVLGTPHPKSGRRSRMLPIVPETPDMASDCGSPNLRNRKVSLLPGMEDKTVDTGSMAATNANPLDLISFNSPVSATPTRRSMRIRRPSEAMKD